MWSSDRRLFLLSGLAVAGCGFQPVYAPNADGIAVRGKVSIAAPEDEEGFALVERLEERLGDAADDALYRLSADIFLDEDPVGFLPDGSISRYTVRGRVEWTLIDANDTSVLSGAEESFASYSATSTTVATIVARRDARRRLMVILADRIVADLLSAPAP